MTSLAFATPNSLSQKELIALRENKFELNCFKMKLESPVSEKRDFSGPGVIRQTPEGQMHFTLYAQETMSVFESLQELTQGMGIPSGAIIPKDKYYRLSAIDLQGREWTCDQVFLGTNSSNEGTICTGRLDEIVYKRDEQDSTKDFLYLEIFDDVKPPYNARTVISKDVAGRESKSFSLNVLKFSVDDIEFFVQKEAESLLLMASSTNQFAKYFELRVIEALQFVLARPLKWSIMRKQTNGFILTSIRETRPDNLKYRVHPPISLSIGNADAFCGIFGRYLEYIMSYPEDKLHPISAQMRSICHASIGFIETKSLILSVAVESILKHVYETKIQLSPEEKEGINKAREYFDSWDGPEKLSDRITGLLSMLSKPSASMQLKELVELGAITEEQRKAWSRFRHKLAHGEGLGSTSIQEFLDLSNTVLILFYHLVFFAIEYQGEYTDYSTIGWPVKNYKAVPQLGEDAT